jgi:alkyl hydroperoxide reductase subunit AhpC
MYGVYIDEGEEKGSSYRASFIIDKKGLLRHFSINDLDENINI